MIDVERFSYWMGVFSAMAGRALIPEEAEAYFVVLSSRLTAEEFEYSARSVLASHRYNTIPRPADFLDAVRADVPAQVDAGPVWDQVVAVVLGYRPPGYSLRQREAEVESELGEVARRALQSAGGAARLLRLEEREHDFMRREFVTALGSIAEVAAHCTGVALLSGGSTAQRIAGGTGARLALEPGEVAPSSAEEEDEARTEHARRAAQELDDAAAWLGQHPDHAAAVARQVDAEVPALPGLARTREIRTAQLAAELRAELAEAAA